MFTYDSVEWRRPGISGSERRVLAICGGGNAGHALAVVASQNFDGDITWLASTPEKAELLRRGVFSQDGLQSTGVITGYASRIKTISCDPADVIPQADIVIIAVPAFAHAPMLRQIAPHLKRRVMLGALPSRSGFEFEATALVPGVEPGGGRVLFGLQTLPWSTRVQEPGKTVNFGALKAQVLMATMPSRHAVDAAPILSQILGTQIIPTGNFLNMTLGNPGQVIHPGLMYGLFGSWRGAHYAEDAIPKFYAHASDETGAFVEQLSADITAVARKIETQSAGALDLTGVLSIHKWLRISYPTQTADMSTAARCFRTGPLQARKAPMVEVAAGMYAPNFAYRYLSEDIPFGLVVSKAIAQIADIGTPAIDTVLRWAQRKLEKRLLRNGRLTAAEIQHLPVPQNYGIATLPDLIEWYARDARYAPHAGTLEDAAV